LSNLLPQLLAPPTARGECDFSVVYNALANSLGYRISLFYSPLRMSRLGDLLCFVFIVSLLYFFC